ncbi:BZ3500_MvSof-1268-A1-R1_Chr4-4g07466 [Microbotryum saponariae]|uniref:Ribonuclease H n=1 Tax=Microbotryum saponariae TaxID=289078 RepID=A0A2X0MQJ2_9BASI|nr:BZ3500_MvSof-1268-A1-R1_Chr4-4g07466 [Microbotryum saponariae]SDA07127.1 BZ3501_MvSof-1269-A2-R1_Chr4-3g07174 [Microbotryum saponariae]
MQASSFGLTADAEAELAPNHLISTSLIVVRRGRVEGIYTTWAEAEVQVKGFSGAKYKKFPDLRSAQEYVAADRSDPLPSGTLVGYQSSALLQKCSRVASQNLASSSCCCSCHSFEKQQDQSMTDVRYQ